MRVLHHGLAVGHSLQLSPALGGALCCPTVHDGDITRGASSPVGYQHSPMEDGWFRDAAQTPTLTRAEAGGTRLLCQPVPLLLHGAEPPQPGACPTRAAALVPPCPSPGSHRAHTAWTRLCLGNCPKAHLPCQPPSHALLEGPAHPRDGEPGCFWTRTARFFQDSLALPASIVQCVPATRQPPAWAVGSVLEKAPGKGTHCQGPFLAHVDLWPNLKPKNSLCLHGHFWNRCRGLISCLQGFPGSELYCDSVTATSSLRTGLPPLTALGCGVC